ncbi:unnamed protein product [Mytilus edulis]|uniref:Uncharacterized protein n=1 Tax=Mytilus edulis TaxID=6550 RepID=A0A8S3UA63_MYTED|nr:unnamed protein product [Mytilus edulis]
MDSEKETDFDLTIQALDQITKCAVEFKKLLRLSNARVKNLEDGRSEEEPITEQKLDCISERLEGTSVHVHEVTILAAELQNNMQKLNFAYQPPNIRERKGRRSIQATDSGFDSTTYSGTSKVLNNDVASGIQDTNPPGNLNQSCSSLSLEASF